MHPYEPETVFGSQKAGYLESMRERRLPEIEALRATWAHTEIDILAALQEWFTPLLEESTKIAAGIGAGIRLTLEDDPAGGRRCA